MLNGLMVRRRFLGTSSLTHSLTHLNFPFPFPIGQIFQKQRNQKSLSSQYHSHSCNCNPKSSLPSHNHSLSLSFLHTSTPKTITCSHPLFTIKLTNLNSQNLSCNWNSNDGIFIHHPQQHCEELVVHTCAQQKRPTLLRGQKENHHPMEIQESVKVMVHRNIHKKWASNKKGGKESEKVPETIVSTPKQKWKKLFFHRSPSHNTKTLQNPPEEFLCPISGSLMSDPVIVSSGHSFDRNSIEACKNLNFTPQLSDGTNPDFSTVIPNLALKSAILKWCQINSTPPHHTSIQNLVRTLISSNPTQHNNNQNKVVTEVTDKELIQGVEENPPLKHLIHHAETEVPRRPTHLYSSSEESIATTSASTPPLQLSTRPSCCYSSPSSSEMEPAATPEEEEIMAKLKNPQVHVIEEAVVTLRKLTRTREETRVQLCTPRLLSALRSLIVSKYTNVQVNALASLVNLSLEKNNKVKIVRSGIVPPLIEVLKCGSSEAQEHACGALFSLALDDDNKTAIGVLGALSPLLYTLRSQSERTRHDSALALYHLSLVQSNRAKMVKLGSVPILLDMVKSGHMTGRVLLILGNLGAGSDGRAAMLDAGVVECLLGLLGGTELGAGSTRESCVSVMYALSHGGLRFKAVAKAAGVVEVLQKVEKNASERAKHKVRKILEMMRAKEVEEEDVDWEELLDSGLGCRTRSRIGSGLDESTANSAEF